MNLILIILILSIIIIALTYNTKKSSEHFKDQEPPTQSILITDEFGNLSTIPLEEFLSMFISYNDNIAIGSKVSYAPKGDSWNHIEVQKGDNYTSYCYSYNTAMVRWRNRFNLKYVDTDDNSTDYYILLIDNFGNITKSTLSKVLGNYVNYSDKFYITTPFPDANGTDNRNLYIYQNQHCIGTGSDDDNAHDPNTSFQFGYIDENIEFNNPEINNYPSIVCVNNITNNFDKPLSFKDLVSLYIYIVKKIYILRRQTLFMILEQMKTEHIFAFMLAKV